MKGYCTDTGCEYDDEEAKEAARICHSRCRTWKGEPYDFHYGHTWCQSWAYHVYEAIETVKDRRALAVLETTLVYFQATGS